MLWQVPNGTPAIVEGKSGNGWVILTGVHAEAPASWRYGMTFTTPVAVDSAYAGKLSCCIRWHFVAPLLNVSPIEGRNRGLELSSAGEVLRPISMSFRCKSHPQQICPVPRSGLRSAVAPRSPARQTRSKGLPIESRHNGEHRAVELDSALARSQVQASPRRVGRELGAQITTGQ